VQTKNPKGSRALNEKHRRFVGACFANGYTASDAHRMMKKEYGVQATVGTTINHYMHLKEYSAAVLAEVGEDRNPSIEAVANALAKNKKTLVHLAGMFQSFVEEHWKVVDDPSYGIVYADRRKRAMKLSQNIDELDEKKTFAVGSYPVSRNADGSMEYKEFKIKNKDHGEQRKTIESLGQMVDGLVSGDVVIQIIDNSPKEDLTPLEQKADKSMAAVKKNRNAGLPVTHEPKEDQSGE